VGEWGYENTEMGPGDWSTMSVFGGNDPVVDLGESENCHFEDIDDFCKENMGLYRAGIKYTNSRVFVESSRDLTPFELGRVKEDWDSESLDFEFAEVEEDRSLGGMLQEFDLAGSSYSTFL
jgi:hypothetical protein